MNLGLGVGYFGADVEVEYDGVTNGVSASASFAASGLYLSPEISGGPNGAYVSLTYATGVIVGSLVSAEHLTGRRITIGAALFEGSLDPSGSIWDGTFFGDFRFSPKLINGHQ